jgi:hypothetical protein
MLSLSPSAKEKILHFSAPPPQKKKRGEGGVLYGAKRTVSVEKNSVPHLEKKNLPMLLQLHTFLDKAKESAEMQTAVVCHKSFGPTSRFI